MSLVDKDEQVEVSGKTLHVYYYLLKKRHACGVREIQRAMGFSSSSTAHYHLEKLTSKGVLTKNSYGNYTINSDAKLHLLKAFFFVHGFVFPKQFLYAVLTSIMCALLLAFFRQTLTFAVLLALSPGIVASAIFWYDTVKIWRSLPSFERSVR